MLLADHSCRSNCLAQFAIDPQFKWPPNDCLDSSSAASRSLPYSFEHQDRCECCRCSVAVNRFVRWAPSVACRGYAWTWPPSTCSPIIQRFRCYPKGLVPLNVITASTIAKVCVLGVLTKFPAVIKLDCSRRYSRWAFETHNKRVINWQSTRQQLQNEIFSFANSPL